MMARGAVIHLHKFYVCESIHKWVNPSLACLAFIDRSGKATAYYDKSFSGI
jgi:hypothetical protein